MAFGAQKIFPIDIKARYAVGVNLPFSSPSVFTSNYLTKDAIKNNLINFFLTEPGERYLNPNFGSGLRSFVFEQITEDNMNIIEDKIRNDLSTYFPSVIPQNIIVYEDQTLQAIITQVSYNVQDTAINDTITLQFDINGQ
jgi:phage baseplate assembly protein W